MKKFRFPLRRAMKFRRVEARVEEVKLEGLYAELRAIEAREAELAAQKTEEEKALRSGRPVSGFDLELFASFREAAAVELARLGKAGEDCRKRIDAQLAVWMGKRREVKLLETLEEKKFAEWEKEMLKEVDREAEEAYLARWARR